MWTKSRKIMVSVIVAIMAFGLVTGIVVAANRDNKTANAGKGSAQSGSCDGTSCGSGNGGSNRGSTGDGYRWGAIIDGGASTMHGEIAKALGISLEEYQKERDSGKSCEEIAAGKGISAEQLAEIEKKVKSDLLDKAVADGKLTQEKAQLLKEKLAEETGSCGESGGNGGGDVSGKGAGNGKSECGNGSGSCDGSCESEK